MTSTQSDGRFRCSECGDGEHLTAWAGANVSGRLLPDGTVEESWTEQHTLFEDSIACERHIDVRIEKLVDGRWTVELPCTWEGALERYPDERVRCKDGRVHFGAYPCPQCKGRARVDVPVEDLARV